MISLMLLGFATITGDRSKGMADLRNINSNVREMKIRGERFSRTVSESTSETYYTMSGYLAALTDCDMTPESKRQLVQFIDLMSDYHINVDRQIQLDVLHLVSWLSATVLQIKQIIYTKTFSREVTFVECFSLTPKEQDALLEGEETNISRVMGYDGVRLYVQFPKLSKETFYMKLKVGKTEFDLMNIEHDHFDVVTKCIHKDAFESGEFEILCEEAELSPCAKAMYASMGSIYSDAIKDLVISKSLKQLNDVDIGQWISSNSKKANEVKTMGDLG